MMITILGPTACGKTQLAVALAYRLNGEVVSADSRQVYQGMDIGTGKDLEDYIYKGVAIPYHLVDICPAGEKYNVYRFQHDFLNIYHNLSSRNVPVILCGGSGLYLESVLRHYDLPTVPQNTTLRRQLEHHTLRQLTALLAELKQQNGTTLHNQSDLDTPQRAIRAIEIEHYLMSHPAEFRSFPAIHSLTVGIDIEREVRRRRITERLRTRLNGGLIDEVQHLLNTTCTPDQLIYYGLEYKYVTEYLLGQYSYEEMFTRLEIAIHQFAKRQMTWFRGMEKRGVNIHWLDATLSEEDKVNTILTWKEQHLAE